MKVERTQGRPSDSQLVWLIGGCRPDSKECTLSLHMETIMLKKAE